jgi:3-hydroxyisobutyrate dehydrogenase-like beta-hydroxyacid dehydrogenase
MGMSVGLVGLGAMGLPIARHVVRGGFRVLGYDLDADAVAAAAAAGASPCEDLESLLREADVVLVLVDGEPAVVSIVEAACRCGAQSPAGQILVIGATIRPTLQRRLADTAAEAGLTLLDGPLCKGSIAAEEGTLLLMGGGDKDAYERCLPVFECFTSDRYLLGPVGAGQVGKLVNNLILWASICSTTEGLRLSEELGVDLDVLIEALLKSSGRTWALETWRRPREMPWAEKDMRMVLEEANESGLSLPLSGVLHEVVKDVKARRRQAASAADGDRR